MGERRLIEDFETIEGTLNCSKCGKKCKYNENGYDCECGWSEC